MHSFVENRRPAARPRESSLLAFLSLFTSIGTLLCCALPSLFVLLGLGATVASVLSAAPFLVSLSHHKPWVFGSAAILISAGFLYAYRWAPRRRGDSCAATEQSACGRAQRVSRVVLWISSALFAVGVFFAYLLAPILARWS
jgi:hypothetical protein